MIFYLLAFHFLHSPASNTLKSPWKIEAVDLNGDNCIFGVNNTGTRPLSEHKNHSKNGLRIHNVYPVPPIQKYHPTARLNMTRLLKRNFMKNLDSFTGFLPNWNLHITSLLINLNYLKTILILHILEPFIFTTKVTESGPSQ